MTSWLPRWRRILLRLWHNLPGSAKYMCDLQPRLRRVAWQLAAGARNKEIAYLLGLTSATVKMYIFEIGRIVGTGDRLQIALWAKNQRYE